MLHIRMREARVRVVFVVLNNLVVSILLRIPLVDKFVKVVFSAEGRKVPHDLFPVQ